MIYYIALEIFTVLFLCFLKAPHMWRKCDMRELSSDEIE
jgi:hypothetical protein